MNVLYSKSSNIDCPDALSRLQYDVFSRSKTFRDWAQRLEKEPDTDKFEVTEAFAVTRSVAATDVQQSIPMPRTDSPENNQLTPVMEEESTVGLGIEVLEAHKTLIRRAIQRSARYSAIYKSLKTAPKLMIDGVERYELTDTCQYVLHDNLLYLVDPITSQHRLTIVGATLQKQHLAAAHSPAHYGQARMADDLRTYYWTKMAQDIRCFLKNCPECLRNKPANHKAFGLLSPIPTPSEPFDT
jgi:hypothetical protein